MATLSGEVRDENNDLLADCVVRAYRRDTGVLLNSVATGDGTPYLLGDPYYESVALLLHCDGTDGSTTFTDSCATPKTITAYGTAHIETDQSKFGGASVYFDGASYISATANAAFAPGTGDFSLEMWVRPSSLGSINMLFDNRNGSVATNALVLYINANGTLSLYGVATGSTGSLGLNAWSRVEVSRTGTTLKCYIGNVEHFSVTNSTNFSTNGFFMGRTNESASNYFTGYIDEVRLTKGLSRHSAAGFDVETEAFPSQLNTTGGPTGEYTLTTSYTGEVQVIALDPDGGTTFNDLILRTTPV